MLESFQMDNVTASCSDAAGVSGISRLYGPSQIKKFAALGLTQGAFRPTHFVLIQVEH